MDQTLSKKKILIAEDEPAMLNALTDKFSQEGCVVLRAENGKVALDLAIKEKPDVASFRYPYAENERHGGFG